MAFALKTREEHLDDLVAGVVARTRLSNARLTSTMLLILDEIAAKFELGDIAIYQLRNLIDIDKSVGPDLDLWLQAILPAAQAERREKTQGATTLIFERSGSSGVAAIPKGTVVSQDKEDKTYFYETTAAGQWDDAQTESDGIAAIAQEGGTGPNANVNAINAVVSNIPAIAVRNTTPLTGQDRETDAEARQRVRDHIRGLAKCTAQAHIAEMRRIELSTGQRVTVVSAIEDPEAPAQGTVYIDDGQGKAEEAKTQSAIETLVSSAVGGEQYLYTQHRPWKTTPTVKRGGAVLAEGTDFTSVAPWGQIRLTTPLAAGEAVTAQDYTYYTGLVAEAQRRIDGDPGDRTDTPGLRALGVVVTGLPSQVYNLTVTGSLVVESGYDHDTVVGEAKSAVIDHVNGLGNEEPNAVYVSRIIERAMSVRGALRFTLTAPASDVYLAPNQVPRTDSAKTTIS